MKVKLILPFWIREKSALFSDVTEEISAETALFSADSYL